MKNVSNSIRLYPWFASISGDLLFFMAIDTLFLTTVKGLGAAEITLMTAIGTGICVILQYPLLCIIHKIGNTAAMRIGVILLIISALCYTCFVEKIFVFLGCIFYYLALFFIEMKSSILRNNLHALNRENEYMQIEARAKLLFSIYTLAIVIIAAPLFNLNHYIPNILCITVTVLACILSFCIHEPATTRHFKKQSRKAELFLPTTLAIVASMLFIPLILITFSLTKLLAQENLGTMFEIEAVAYFITGLVLASRIARIISNAFFAHFGNKITSKSLFSLSFALIFAILLAFFGGIANGVAGYILILIAIMLLYGVMDPYQIMIKKIIFEHTDNRNAQTALTLNFTALNLGQMCLNFVATAMLFNLPIVYVLAAFLAFSVIEIIVIFALVRSLRENIYRFKNLI